jgi:protein-L-isoaspartate(D-aspartate) O-methyltransferase
VQDTHDPYFEARTKMVQEQIASRDVRERRVLDAMLRVPRHAFMPRETWWEAYEDHPVSIGMGQTISQPYIVAKMTELAEVKAGARVLEVGTGSGYQAAVLAQLGAEVYSIEIIPELARRASATLAQLGYVRVHVKQGDGYRGWPEHAPFDAILVTTAPPAVPPPLLEQLAVGGRLVVPVGVEDQYLDVIVRTVDGYRTTRVFPVRFVPMTGEAARSR